MKIAISANGSSLGATLDPRFGRCIFFLIVETKNMSVEAIKNPNIDSGGGAGIQSAQLMAEKGVQIVLTGNCGPNAYKTFSSSGIEVITGCAGTVKDVVEGFKNGSISVVPQKDKNYLSGMKDRVKAFANLQQSNVFGRGMGVGGRGRGCGRVGGMGRGGGQRRDGNEIWQTE